MFKYFTTILISTIIFLSASSVSAAVIYVFPEQGSFELKQEIIIDIKVNSEGEGINAVQATVAWPANLLEFVEASKEGSVLSFWVDEPKLGDASDSLSFTGGTAKGISGDALQILKIKFKTKGAGAAEISLSDAAVTASDGQGTNVLSKINGVSYQVGAAVFPPKTSEPASTAPPASTSAPAPPPPVLQPERVERKAVPASQLPPKPIIKIPQYSDDTKWHNHLGETIAFWEVPDDVILMALDLNNSPNTIPQQAEKELATGKNFGILEDGIWYIHARFKNNIGWGPSAHYRVAVDTKPPLAFSVTFLEGETTDNPAPTLQFNASDALSGLREYQIKIDNGEINRVLAPEFKGSFILPLQTPGTHQIVIKAVDQAENSIEDSITFEILPIPSPDITFITKELFSDTAAAFTVRGTALPGVNVLLQVQQLLRKEGGEVVAQSSVFSDERGDWRFTFDEPLRNGRYIVTAQSQDARGALSLVVKSLDVVVKSKPIIQIGPLQLGKGGAAILLLLILVIGFGGGIWFYKKRQRKLALRVFLTEFEITKIFQLLKQDIDQLNKSLQTPTAGDDEYALKRLQENIQKMETYLKKGVEKIKK